MPRKRIMFFFNADTCMLCLKSHKSSSISQKLCYPVSASSSPPSFLPSLSLFFFLLLMFSTSLSSPNNKSSLLQPWKTRLVIEGCDRHANAVLDLNNMQETHRVGERARESCRVKRKREREREGDLDG